MPHRLGRCSRGKDPHRRRRRCGWNRSNETRGKTEERSIYAANGNELVSIEEKLRRDCYRKLALEGRSMDLVRSLNESLDEYFDNFQKFMTRGRRER